VTDLLQNGDFTGGTYRYTDPWGNQISELELPQGWELFTYQEKGEIHRPETKVERTSPDPELVAPVWKAFTSYSRHHYSLGQRVPVAFRTELSFYAWVFPWSSSQDKFGESVGGSYRVRVGIDPFGGVDPESRYIKWSHKEPGYKAMDVLQELIVEAVAEAGMVTVWLQGDCEWPLKHNDAFWDGARLWALSVPEPPEPPAGDLEARLARLEAIEAERETVEAFGLQFVTKRN